ncbi:alpha/beta hydrolase [uncultured Chitinophaga sp.]|uniref:alpha/beta hydrolase n=1 Tax=uncultured Chitinophaga sp. TaxID=339340 RepID=UPI0025D5FD1C|nr:alpha/beta hydrolase [uncultured Chitinophaga sp.]
MRITLLLFFFVITGLTACKDTTDGSPLPVTTQQRIRDVSYGPDPRNKMDVYLTANRTGEEPFMLLIHGGGWVGGSKNDMNGVQEAMLAQGISSASISYRYVSTTVHGDALMEDVGKALDKVLANSTTWTTRKTKIILCGASAGAHMSLLYGYKQDAANIIGGVISLAGPTDLTQTAFLDYAAAIGAKSAIENLAGAPYTTGQPINSKFSEVSPVSYLKNVPSLLIHGTADNVVPYVQATILEGKLKAAGYTHKLIPIPNAGHDLGVAQPLVLQMILNEVTAWAKAYGK